MPSIVKPVTQEIPANAPSKTTRKIATPKAGIGTIQVQGKAGSVGRIDQR